MGNMPFYFLPQITGEQKHFAHKSTRILAAICRQPSRKGGRGPGRRYTPSPPKRFPPRRPQALTAALRPPPVSPWEELTSDSLASHPSQGQERIRVPSGGASMGKGKGRREGKASLRGPRGAATQGTAGFLYRTSWLSVRARGRGPSPSTVICPQASPRTKTPRNTNGCFFKASRRVSVKASHSTYGCYGSDHLLGHVIGHHLVQEVTVSP